MGGSCGAANLQHDGRGVEVVVRTQAKASWRRATRYQAISTRARADFGCTKLPRRWQRLMALVAHAVSYEVLGVLSLPLQCIGSM